MAMAQKTWQQINIIKVLSLFLSVVVIFLLLAHSVYADSEYVLPYPSVMPGSKLYAIKDLLDKTMKVWYFGNFGQFDYTLKQSDKYLVEAKTLFEYKQYLLGYNALIQSNNYIVQAPSFLTKARKAGENTQEKKSIFTSATQKHIEVLQSLKSSLPKSFLWQPEKSTSTDLQLQSFLQKSIELRRNLL